MNVVSGTNCILTPSTGEGPYFVDERLLRSDIRADAQVARPRKELPSR